MNKADIYRRAPFFNGTVQSVHQALISLIDSLADTMSTPLKEAVRIANDITTTIKELRETRMESYELACDIYYLVEALVLLRGIDDNAMLCERIAHATHVLDEVWEAIYRLAGTTGITHSSYLKFQERIIKALHKLTVSTNMYHRRDLCNVGETILPINAEMYRSGSDIVNIREDVQIAEKLLQTAHSVKLYPPTSTFHGHTSTTTGYRTSYEFSGNAPGLWTLPSIEITHSNYLQTKDTQIGAMAREVCLSMRVPLEPFTKLSGIVMEAIPVHASALTFVLFRIPIRPDRAQALETALAGIDNIPYIIAPVPCPRCKPEEISTLLLGIKSCQIMINTLQSLLESNPNLRIPLLRQLTKICHESNMVPSRLFLPPDSIHLDDRDHPVICGGYADIFKGTYPRTGTKIAAKRLRVHSMAGQDPIRKFCQELILWRFLDHPNILPLLGMEPTIFAPYLCMVSPWMKNGNMQQYIRANRPPVDDVLVFLDQVSQALEYLHEQEIVHGDLRSMNILVDDGGNPQLTDFGLSILAEDAASTSIGGHTAVRWCAPELITGALAYPNIKTDIYAFGCVCLEGLSGKLPFASIPADVAVFYRILSNEPPGSHDMLDIHGSSIPDAMWEFMEACWSTESSLRPSLPCVFSGTILRVSGEM